MILPITRYLPITKTYTGSNRIGMIAACVKLYSTFRKTSLAAGAYKNIRKGTKSEE
jgi:hypothetical protein